MRPLALPELPTPGCTSEEWSDEEEEAYSKVDEPANHRWPATIGSRRSPVGPRGGTPYSVAAKTGTGPAMPLSECEPLSVNVRSEPSTRSLTVRVASTSPGPASAMSR